MTTSARKSLTATDQKRSAQAGEVLRFFTPLSATRQPNLIPLKRAPDQPPLMCSVQPRSTSYNELANRRDYLL